METLIGILEETPWWVYVLFAYLVSIGVKAMRDRTVSLKQLVIAPAVFILWGLSGLGWEIPSILSWLAALVIGSGLGWLSVRKWKIRYDRGKGTLRLPGSPSTLVLALLFFSVKYFFGYYGSTHQVPYAMALAQTAVSGLLAGMFVGRLIFFWKTYEEV